MTEMFKRDKNNNFSKPDAQVWEIHYTFSSLILLLEKFSYFHLNEGYQIAKLTGAYFY